MKISQQVIVKRWKPILEEYEKIQNKVLPRSFRFVKELCLAHYISNKELRRYYRKWQKGKKQDDSLLPAQRGARPGSPRRTPKEIERNIMKAYRRFGSNRYELVLLFKPYVCSPDIVTVVALGDCEPITNTYLKVEQQVAIIGKPHIIP